MTTSETRIEWYDSPDPARRCNSVQFWPDGETDELGDPTGRIFSSSRMHPGDVWDSAALITTRASIGEAQQFAGSLGCHYQAAPAN